MGRFGGAIGPSKKIIFPHYGGCAAVVRDGWMWRAKPSTPPYLKSIEANVS
jgi:hypothetical protein